MFKIKRQSPNVWIRGNYKIKRWNYIDSCGKHFQYAAYYKDKALHRNPFVTLEEAKTKLEQHYDLKKLRRERDKNKIFVS